jgi:hypothetical protein
MRMVLLAAIAAVVFEVFVLVFVASAEASAVRTMPKWVWILLCVVFPVLGGIAYLIFGRPVAGEQGYAGASGKPTGGAKTSEPRQGGMLVFLKNFLGYDDDENHQPNLPPDFKYQPEPRQRKGPVAPDDDPEFLRELDRKLKKQRKDSEETQPSAADGTAPQRDSSHEEPGDEESGDKK